MKKSPLNRLDKNGLISSAEGAASGAYKKSALNMLGISRKSSPLNELTQRQEQMRDIIKQKNPKENPTGKPESVDTRKSVSRKSSSPLNDFTEQENEITAHGMPVYEASGKPISAEKMRYFENLNKLYPEHVYDKDKDPTAADVSDRGYPGFRTEEMDGKTVLMPKSTSVSHVWSAQKDGERSYTKGMDSLSTLPGYKVTIGGKNYFR